MRGSQLSQTDGVAAFATTPLRGGGRAGRRQRQLWPGPILQGVYGSIGLPCGPQRLSDGQRICAMHGKATDRAPPLHSAYHDAQSCCLMRQPAAPYNTGLPNSCTGVCRICRQSRRVQGAHGGRRAAIKVLQQPLRYSRTMCRNQLVLCDQGIIRTPCRLLALQFVSAQPATMGLAGVSTCTAHS